VVGNKNKQTNKKANDFFGVQKKYSWHQENINMFFLGNGKKDSKVFFLGCRRGFSWEMANKIQIFFGAEEVLSKLKEHWHVFFKQWKNIKSFFFEWV
jgi:hypothetical protein